MTSGARTDIEFRADPDRDGGWLVLRDGVTQSYVDVADPTHLPFLNMRLLAHALDVLPPGPLRVVHVGGAACTLARYVAHTRPGSAQLVIDPDEELTRLVLDRFPLPDGSDVRFVPTDGRTGIAGLPDASADVVILDAFDGGIIPADVTAQEAVADVARVLAPDGVFLHNSVCVPERHYAGRVAATVRSVLPHTVVLGVPLILQGILLGNVVVLGSRAPLPAEDLAGRASRDLELPIDALLGTDLDEYVGGASVLSDADPEASPAPVG